MKHFYCYHNCSTCKKAQQWLDTHHITYTATDLVATPPTAAQFLSWFEQFDHPLKYYFNTSGQHYRQQNLKAIVPTLTPQQAAELLSSDGMLIKRPLMVDEHQLTCGFKVAEYTDKWSE